MATWLEAARRLGRSERQVRRMVEDGRLEAGEDCAVDDDSLAQLAGEIVPHTADAASMAATFAETVRALTAPQKLWTEAATALLAQAIARVDELEKRLAASFDDRERLASEAANREKMLKDAEAARKLREEAAARVFDLVGQLADNWMMKKDLEPAQRWAAGFTPDQWAAMVNEAPAELRAALELLRKDKKEDGKAQPDGHSEAGSAQSSEGQGPG